MSAAKPIPHRDAASVERTGAAMRPQGGEARTPTSASDCISPVLVPPETALVGLHRTRLHFVSPLRSSKSP